MSDMETTMEGVKITIQYRLPDGCHVVRIKRNGVRFIAGTVLDHYQIEPTVGVRSGKVTGYTLYGPRGAVYTLTRESRGALVPTNRSNSPCMIRGVGWFWDTHGVLRPGDLYDAVTAVEERVAVQVPLPFPTAAMTGVN